MQPFMMGYNNVTVDDFTYFKEMKSRTGVHPDITAVSMLSLMKHPLRFDNLRGLIFGLEKDQNQA